MGEKTTERPEDAGHDAGRRRVLTGAAASGLVYTVASRPVWANTVCTKSILLSGNLSAHPEQVNCQFGCSPGFWRNAQEACWMQAGFSRNQLFEDVFALHTIPEHDSLPDGDNQFFGATLYDILNFSGPSLNTNPLRLAAFHGVAGLLNASHPDIAIGSAFPFTPAAIIDGFQDAYAFYLKHQGRRNTDLKLEQYKNQLDDFDNGRVCPLSNHCT